MNDVLDDINNYNKNRDKKVLMIFDDMIADIMRSEKVKAIVKEIFIRCRKLNISIVFITQSYFRTLKDARLNSTRYILMKIGNKKELKSIAEENSGHLDFKDFLKIYSYCTKEPYSFMMVDTRPNARATFKKNFDEPIDLQYLKIMTRKEQNKILDDKIESNVNQYKVDRLNAEISAFSSGDLNKYEFLTRKHLKYKPNELDKARFKFFPLGQTFSTGLDKTAQGYKEEEVIKLLKDIRDGLARASPGLREPRGPGDNDDSDDNDDNDDNNDIPDLETEEESAERIAKVSHDDKVFNVLKNFKNNIESKISNLDKMLTSKENKWNTKLNKLNNDVKKLDDYIKENNDKKINMEKKLDIFEKEGDYLSLRRNQLNEELNKTKNELYKTKNVLDEEKDDAKKKTY